MGPRAAGGAGAPSSRTPPHPTPTAKRAVPWTSSRTPLSPRAVSTVHCADDGRGRRVTDYRKPQPSPPRPFPSSTPWGGVPYRHRSRSPSRTGPSRSLRIPALSPASSRRPAIPGPLVGTLQNQRLWPTPGSISKPSRADSCVAPGWHTSLKMARFRGQPTTTN